MASSPPTQLWSWLNGCALQCSFASGMNVRVAPCSSKSYLTLWVVIPADYSGQLTALLRYPAPPETRPASRVNHTCLLLQQALFLQRTPNPSSSATVAMENRTALNIPIEVPVPPPPPQRRPVQRRQQAGTSPNGEGPRHLGHVRQSSSPPLGIPEMLARGILERGESLGINKTLISAVAELKVSTSGYRTLASLTLFAEKHPRHCCQPDAVTKHERVPS